jgi:hypothetical protein
MCVDFSPKKNRKNSAVVFLGGDGGGCCSEQASRQAQCTRLQLLGVMMSCGKKVL